MARSSLSGVRNLVVAIVFVRSTVQANPGLCARRSRVDIASANQSDRECVIHAAFPAAILLATDGVQLALSNPENQRSPARWLCTSSRAYGASGVHTCCAAVSTVSSPPKTAGAARTIGEAKAPVLSNWNKSYFFTPAKYVEPTTVDEIQAVRSAHEGKHKQW